MKILFIIVLVGLCTWFMNPLLPQSPLSHQIDNQTSNSSLEDSNNQQIHGLEVNLWNLINQYRYEKHRDPLQWSLDQHITARQHSEYMANTGHFEHSNLSYYENIFMATGYSLDNIPEATLKAWQESPKHNENLLDPDIAICGIGIAQTDSTIYVTFLAQ